jgi:hypothetical protein
MTKKLLQNCEKNISAIITYLHFLFNSQITPVYLQFKKKFFTNSLLSQLIKKAKNLTELSIPTLYTTPLYLGPRSKRFCHLAK